MIPIILITFASSFVISITGFGFGLVSMSVFPLLMSVREANMLTTLLALPVILINLIPSWRSMKPKILLPLMAFTLVGAPLGIFFLVRLNERYLLLGLGVVIILTLALNAFRSNEREWKPRLWLAAIAGTVGGAFGGAYATSGPPITLYLSGIIKGKVELKTNLLAYFLFIVVIRLIFFGFVGMFTSELMRNFLIALFPLAAGIAAGTLLFKRLSSRWIHRIVQALLCVSAVILISRGF